MNRTLLRFGVVLIVVALIAACAASSHVLIGTQRAPIDPANVKLYTTPPAKYEQIAIIDASSQSSWATGDQAKMNKVIERLKEEAAALGANGVLLQSIGGQNMGMVGTNVGTATAYGTGNTVNAYGAGTSFYAPVMHKSGQGIAIFVTEK